MTEALRRLLARARQEAAEANRKLTPRGEALGQLAAAAVYLLLTFLLAGQQTAAQFIFNLYIAAGGAVIGVVKWQRRTECELSISPKHHGRG
jgi:hypothetical protein